MADDHRAPARPADIDGPKALFAQTALDVERWAVAQIGGQPTGNWVDDHGIDGVICFPGGVGPHAREGRVLLAVKAGAEPDPRTVRELASAIADADADADMAVLVVRGDPTPRLIDAARHAGTHTSPVDDRTYPRIQVLGFDQLLSGDRPAVTTPSAS